MQSDLTFFAFLMTQQIAVLREIRCSGGSL